jgi:hypothetical protein
MKVKYWLWFGDESSLFSKIANIEAPPPIGCIYRDDSLQDDEYLIVVRIEQFVEPTKNGDSEEYEYSATLGFFHDNEIPTLSDLPIMGEGGVPAVPDTFERLVWLYEQGFKYELRSSEGCENYIRESYYDETINEEITDDLWKRIRKLDEDKS